MLESRLKILVYLIVFFALGLKFRYYNKSSNGILTLGMLGAEFAVAEMLLDDLKQDILQQNPSINNHLMEF